MIQTRFFLSLILLCFALSASAQELLKGNITDEQGYPIPSAKIFVKNAVNLVAADSCGTSDPVSLTFMIS